MTYAFIADVHLGKLAKALRLLGFDTVYSNVAAAAQLRAMATEQNSILLSRYAGYQNDPHLQTFVIHSADPLEQLQQVMQQFHLKEKLQPFSRCLVCNGLLTTVTKELIKTQLQPNTRQAFDMFWQCNSCQRIYWKGSHYERMLRLIEKVKQFSN